MECLAGTTLGEFIIRQQAAYPHATGELSTLLSSLQRAARVVNREINRAGISDVLGSMDQLNVQGEEQQKLDWFANERFKEALAARGEVCGLASEEEDGFVTFSPVNKLPGKYVVLIDPLDGSSNIDVNISVGTIFSIYRRVSPIDGPVVLADFLALQYLHPNSKFIQSVISPPFDFDTTCSTSGTCLIGNSQYEQ